MMFMSPSAINYICSDNSLITGELDDTALDLGCRRVLEQNGQNQKLDDGAKIQAVKKDGHWFTLNNASLQVYQRLERDGKCRKVKVDVVPLRAVPLNIRRMMVPPKATHNFGFKKPPPAAAAAAAAAAQVCSEPTGVNAASKVTAMTLTLPGLVTSSSSSKPANDKNGVSDKRSMTGGGIKLGGPRLSTDALENELRTYVHINPGAGVGEKQTSIRTKTGGTPTADGHGTSSLGIKKHTGATGGVLQLNNSSGATPKSNHLQSPPGNGLSSPCNGVATFSNGLVSPSNGSNALSNGGSSLVACNGGSTFSNSMATGGVGQPCAGAEVGVGGGGNGSGDEDTSESTDPGYLKIGQQDPSDRICNQYQHSNHCHSNRHACSRDNDATDDDDDDDDDYDDEYGDSDDSDTCSDSDSYFSDSECDWSQDENTTDDDSRRGDGTDGEGASSEDERECLL